jgi:lysophospholipase L1-like esterase
MDKDKTRIIFFGDSLTKRSSLMESTDPSHRFALDYCESYVDIFNQNEIRVIQLSTTPSPNQADKNSILESYDRIIRKRCIKYDNAYVALKEAFIKISDYNKYRQVPINLFNDGCHRSELGNVLIANKVFEVMIKKMKSLA